MFVPLSIKKHQLTPQHVAALNSIMGMQIHLGTGFLEKMTKHIFGVVHQGRAINARPYLHGLMFSQLAIRALHANQRRAVGRILQQTADAGRVGNLLRKLP